MSFTSRRGRIFFIMKLSTEIEGRFDASYNSLEQKRELWDEVESIFANKLNDELSAGLKSQVMDQKLATLILEREARVMAQLPTGKFRPISTDDMGTSKLMNLINDKYIIPNANAQFSLLTKLRMMDRYSNIYGNFFGLVDWDIKKNGYVGPDLWLISIRDVFPQMGAMSLEDSEHVIVRTWKPISYFEGLAKDKKYKNIPKIIEKLKKLSADKNKRDNRDESVRESDQYYVKLDAKGQGYYAILTQFERDRWVEYVPAIKEVARDIDNPHDNGELPLVCKYSIPLIDDFMGMGDMERGKTMQYTLNSLWNLYLDAIKISIFPPTILNKDNIIASTIKWGPGAKWLVRNSVGNSVQQLAVNPRGIEAFQSTYQVVNSSILNMFGTTDTSVSKETDPGFGRTPRALAMQQQRENAKDNVDRFYMEQTVSDVMKKFANLWSKKSPSGVTLRMFKSEIEDLASVYPEIRDMYNEKTGKLTINKKKTGSTLYDYEIVTGSTYQMDTEKQQAALREIFGIITENMQVNPQTGQVTSPILESMRAEGKEVKLGELLTRIISGSGIQDWSKIVIDKNQIEGNKEITDEELKALHSDQQQFLQTLMQMQGGMQGGINSVPAQEMPQSPQAGPQMIPQQAPPENRYGMPNLPPTENVQ